MLKNIWRKQTPQFTSVLNVLYVNGKPAAIHFGMQSGTVLHYWFPGYDVSLAKYSCGAVLLLFMLRHAAEHGITLIDLGKGDDDYKFTFANTSLPLAEGTIETRRVAAACRRGWQQARQWVCQSGIREHARTPIRWLRQFREWLALR